MPFLPEPVRWIFLGLDLVLAAVERVVDWADARKARKRAKVKGLSPQDVARIKAQSDAGASFRGNETLIVPRGPQSGRE